MGSITVYWSSYMWRIYLTKNYVFWVLSIASTMSVATSAISCCKRLLHFAQMKSLAITIAVYKRQLLQHAILYRNVSRYFARNKGFKSSFYSNWLLEWDRLDQNIRQSKYLVLFRRRLFFITRSPPMSVLGNHNHRGRLILAQLCVAHTKLYIHKLKHMFETAKFSLVANVFTLQVPNLNHYLKFILNTIWTFSSCLIVDSSKLLVLLENWRKCKRYLKEFTRWI